MADTVQRTLEQMIPELEDLQIAGVFSKEEIKAIVQKRRDFEYAIKRIEKEKVDFLRYVQYELNLEQLKKKRMKRLGVKILGRHGEFGGIGRIHTLFRKALRKFRGDIRFWLQYIEFSIRSGSARALNKTFAEALRLHTQNAQLWILAASWEYEQNNNILAARVLLQQAIKVIPRSPLLYVEYARLELIYRDRVKEKMKLGDKSFQFKPKGSSIDISGVPKTAHEAEQMDVENEDEDNQFYNEEKPEEEGKEGEHFISVHDENKVEGDPAHGDRAKLLEGNPFLEGAILKVIFRKATHEIPDDLDMRKNFINVLRLFNDTEHLIDDVYSGIAKDFSKNDDALHIIAERPLAHFELSSKQPTASAIAKATHNYQQVLKSHQSAGLLEYFMVFVETSSHIMDDATKAKVKTFVDTLTRDNVTSFPINEASAILLIKFLIESNATKQAVQYAFKLVNEHPTISKSNAVWALLFGFLNKLRDSASSMSWTDPEVVKSDEDMASLYRTALKAVDRSSSAPIWDSYLTFCFDTKMPFEELQTIFQKAIESRGVGLEKVKEDVIGKAIEYLSTEQIRDLYQKALFTKPWNISLIDRCLDYEESILPDINNKRNSVDYSKIRELYEKAVSEYGVSSPELWLRYITWENTIGQLQKGTALYWRAMKTVKDASSFSALHSQYINTQ
jgi:U3 small nucleolar RNA-associated protein 6